MRANDLSNIKDHPSYQLEDKVASICKPLFDKFPIGYFNYMCKYPDNSLGALITNASWMEYYLQRDYPVMINGQSMHPWTVNIPTRALDDAAIKFNLFNGILVERFYDGCIEVLEFASSSPSDSPLAFCCNKELLNQFFIYFKDKAKDLLRVIKHEPLRFSRRKYHAITPEIPSYYEFLQSIRTNKIRFHSKSKEVVFSRREYEVISLLSQGLTIKEVASCLKLSPRTVETYLKHAKNKSSQLNTSQLLELVQANLF